MLTVPCGQRVFMSMHQAYYTDCTLSLHELGNRSVVILPLVFCLMILFFQSYSVLGLISQKCIFGNCWSSMFYRLGALAVTQPTTLSHCIFVNEDNRYIDKAESNISESNCPQSCAQS